MKINPYLDRAVKTLDRKTGEEFNPYNFGVPGRSGTRKVSASERLFDKSGELNASSDLEALQQIKGIIDGMHDGSFNVSRQANYGENLTAEEGDAILREAFADPTSEGFNQVGQALLNPVKEIIDYEGVARKFLAVRTVKQGEVVRYDKDLFVVAHVIGEDGQTEQSVVEGRYVYPPEFEVSSYVSIELKDTYRAQFDILNRAQDKARQAVEYREDVNFTTLATAAGTVLNTQSFFATLNLAAFEAMRYQIERHRLVCDKFLIHRQEISDLVNTVSAQVDPVTQRELVMAGYIGNILNASIVTTAGVNTYEVLQPGIVQAFAAPDYLGGMPIRVELMSEPTNEFHEGRPRKGWYWWELISQVIINPAGVALGQKT